LRWSCSEGHVWEASVSQLTRGSWCPYCAERRLTIEDLQQIAELRGGKCLSVRYVGSKSKLKFECGEGHRWKTRADSLRGGSWCPKCNINRQKSGIDEMRLIAAKKGGQCLSSRYVNAHTKLTWKCKSGHIFRATPSHIKHDRWCRICGNQNAAIDRRLSMNEIRELAKSRHGRCLSDSYDPKGKLKWRCDKGHIWEANIHNVKSGSWCPVCGHLSGGHKRLNIEIMRELAAQHGGRCLSPSYQNVDSKLKWQCSNGHVWSALPSSVRKGHWCAECAGKKPLDLEHAQEVAHERGGQCLSRKYRSNHMSLRWRCADGHTWSTSYSNIKWGGWCPECSSGLGERICRAYFEQMFARKFPKSRPDWLINRAGYQMELDGYCMDLALAFEHQGRQHFIHTSQFHTAEQFKKRERDDRTKRILCRRNNVTLIEIPQILYMLPLGQIQSYILEKCRKKGYRCPPNSKRVRVNLRAAYSPTGHERLQAIRKAAIANGGRCLSPAYLGSQVHLKFRCAAAHEWETLPHVILKGHWCPECSASERGRKRRLPLKLMQEMAASRGGKCLSQTYINANSHLLWECSKGHRWKAIPNSVNRGSWCPICGKNHRRSRLS
jgi:hypothetical protein